MHTVFSASVRDIDAYAIGFFYFVLVQLQILSSLYQFVILVFQLC